MSSSSALPVAMTGSARVLPAVRIREVPVWLWLAPRNAAIAIMHVYRTVVSPLYGDVCKYYPSCSAYSLGAYQQHGLTGGIWRTVFRLGRCHPWAVGGVDDVSPHTHFRYDLTNHGFVVPRPKRKD